MWDFPKILTYDVILVPKISQNDPILIIFIKNDLCFYQIDPVNDKRDKFGQNRSFLVKMVKIGSFWGQNEATGQNLGDWEKYFSLKVSKNYFSQVNGQKFGEKCH